MAARTSGGSPKPGDSESERRESQERRSGKERRRANAGPPEEGVDNRRAERRKGLDRRRQHLHYDELTTHPRPERNINDYPLSTDEVEFINAINDYKEKFSRPFPTWSEVLHVLRTLGYIRVDMPFPFPTEGGPFDPPPPAAGDPAGDAAGKGKPAEKAPDGAGGRKG